MITVSSLKHSAKSEDSYAYDNELCMYDYAH
ncbi:Neopullulanase [Escherichia coli]|uniref:Neopullulanase n=1 Tax=Escherichia coli TaxID=562 RepID=A0A377CFM4_ECOLX|nr:Neopullulanase [Escherichia coli]